MGEETVMLQGPGLVVAAFVAFAAIVFAASVIWVVAERARRREVEARFAPVLEIEREIEAASSEKRSALADVENLRSMYASKKRTYDSLASQVAIFEDKLSLSEVGVYDPHFDFTDSEEFKRQISLVRDQQKAVISARNAVVCNTQWRVDNSTAKGKTMSDRNARLTLRAFNNECEAAIANVRWNNVTVMEKRILNARAQIDKLNASNDTHITEQFVSLKLKELFLTHEYREKLKSEREERAEASRLAKEEAKLLRDLEKAQDDEAHYQRLLDKARAEASQISGQKLSAFEDQIKILERDLNNAHARVERAQALAERTRSGYVYIISNVGAFGPEMIKIGLTRRLDPIDRVRELGDASVPFYFDTHAIIYSDDAPSLERTLHAEFDRVRVNTQNYRKEFFKASIDEVEAAVKRLAPSAPFFKDVEAQEYRETLARRRVRFESVSSDFPSEL